MLEAFMEMGAGILDQITRVVNLGCDVYKVNVCNEAVFLPGKARLYPEAFWENQQFLVQDSEIKIREVVLPQKRAACFLGLWTEGYLVIKSATVPRRYDYLVVAEAV